MTADTPQSIQPTSPLSAASVDGLGAGVGLPDGILKRRRNSTLQVVRCDGRVELWKSYHGVYTAAEEQLAYARIAPLCAAIEGLRLPEIYGVDVATNTIRMEYVDGTDLRELIATGGLRELAPVRSRLVRLFAAARHAEIDFDSDPANFMLCRTTDELVVVDPVCQDMDLPDFVVVVFLFGLVKSALVRPWNGRWARLRPLLKEYLLDYCRHCESVDPAVVQRQLAVYIDEVIRWNGLAASGESSSLRLLRRFIWTPMLRALQWTLLKRGRTSA